jgi:hypothetical protein
MSRARLGTDERETVAPARPQSRRALDRRALICMVLGVVVLAGGLVAALSHSAQRRTGTNGVWPQLVAGELVAGQRACQDGELLPAGTAEAQLPVQPLQAVGPRVTVTLSRQGRTLARTSALVTTRDGTLRVPLRATARDLDDVTLCLTPRAGRVGLIGGPTPPGAGSLTLAGQQTGASLAIGYLAAGTSTWWEHAATVADRMALGRGNWGGHWLVWFAGLLLLASLVLVGSALVRGVIAPAAEESTDGRLRGVPALAWVIAAVAVCSAAAWSILTPAFQVPDEQTHVAYAQQLAEAGRPPIAKRSDERLAPELLATQARTRFGTLEARTYGAAVWSPLQQQLLDTELHAGLARRSENDTVGPAAPEPPTYYALEAIPYRVASGATLLDRIALMRLLSALMAGVTALFVFLFVRECLPGRPWAWTVGALGAALSPVLGFVSGGVNPDALLFPICAALFYALAVAFRRGLTTRLAVWIGVILALGLIGKINFYGLVPGALLALALGIAVAPFLLLTALDALVWNRAFVLAHTPAERPEDHGNLGGQLSYLWQVFLPRLPGQATAFPEFYPGWQLWLKGFIGKFGWTVVNFSEWAYRLGALLLGLVVALAASTLWRGRAVVRQRRWELLGYAAMSGGLLLLIGLVALRGFAPGISGAIQGRYLLPLLALFAALLALAARGAGARWGRAVGVSLVLACVGWSLFGQLLTIAWFYG